MTLFMALAACVGVLQLAVLGWLAGRTVRTDTLFLCVVAGLYACGAAALLLQYATTRGLGALTGEPLFEVVRTASYTVDPFIEELVKVVPLFLLGMRVRLRRQWGLTDFLLLGAALGAGFGLLEAILRFSHHADTAIPSIDGWIVPLDFSATFVPDLTSIMGSWLPAPATTAELSFVTEPETFLHLAWSAVAGLGVGVLLRVRGPLRLLGLLPILFVSAEHAALNYDLSAFGREGFADLLTAPLLGAHRLLWLYPLLGLAVAGLYDRRDIVRSRAAMPDVLLPNDRATLLALAFLRPPWTVLISTRFVRARRSLFYTHALTTDDELRTGVRAVRVLMGRSSRLEAWKRVALPAGASPAMPVRDWRIWVWLILSLPSALYFVVSDFPGTAGLQRNLETAPVWRLVLPVLLAAGLVWLVWRMAATIRAEVAPVPGEALARVRLRLLAGLGGLLFGGYALLQILLGSELNSPPVRNLHVLDALAAALLIVLVVLVLALLFAAFPPAGGLALAGIGSSGGGAAIAVSGEMVVGTALVGTLSTIMLMQAAGGDGGGSAGPSGPERDGIRLDRSGKVHTRLGQNLPDRVPDHWTRAELRELADDLRTSIANRKAEAIRLGEDGPHRARIADEERLLRQIEKILSGS